MSAPMKTRRTKGEVPIQIGDRKPRLFLVPKDQAEGIVRMLRDFEIDEKGAAPWRAPVQDLIDKYTEPGVVLRGARGKEGLTQTELAEKMGIPASNISEMEHGKRPIGKNMAKRLAEVLKIDYKVFL